MANELMLIQAVSNVSQAVTSLATSARTFGTIRKQDAVVLEEKLIYLKRVCRAKGYGMLTRQSIDEMEKTYQSIKEKNFSGPTLNMAMKLLSLQCQVLYENIQAYSQND